MPIRKANRAIRSLARSNQKKRQKLISESEGIEAALERVQMLEKEMTKVIREMEEKVKQLEYLIEFSGLMNSSLDIPIVQKKALEATCKLLACETASLLLVDRKKGELFWESSLGGDDSRAIRIPIDDQSIPGYVAMTGEGVIVNNAASDPRCQGIKGQAAVPFQTQISVPLRAKDKIIGVLQALNKALSISSHVPEYGRAKFCENDKKLLETLSHSISIAIENARLYSEIKKNFFETVEALAEAIEKKDRYTGGHTKRVVHYSACISKYLYLSQEELEQVRLAAILHDVGKIGIEDKILKKQDSLDPKEWKTMQKHPDLGYEILARVEGLKDVIGGTRYHHERWDGGGYPLGLKGEEIPLVARIIAVADAFDAMVSTRPYRKGIDPKIAYDEIVRCSAVQFDPSVVEAFQEAFRLEKMGKGSGGSSFPLSNCD